MFEFDDTSLTITKIDSNFKPTVTNEFSTKKNA